MQFINNLKAFFQNLDTYKKNDLRAFMANTNSTKIYHASQASTFL